MHDADFLNINNFPNAFKMVKHQGLFRTEQHTVQRVKYKKKLMGNAIFTTFLVNHDKYNLFQKRSSTIHIFLFVVVVFHVFI